LVLILALIFTPVCSQAGPSTAVNAVMAADGRTVTFKAPGFTDFQGGFSATIISGSETQVISSVLGTANTNQDLATEATPYGTAKVIAKTIHFEKEQVDLLFRLGQVPGVPGLLAQAGIRNVGQSPVRLVSVTPVELAGQVAGDPSEWLITSLDRSVKFILPVVAFGDIIEPLHVYEYGGFYNTDGSGFLFGPVGSPVAYVEAVFEYGEGGKLLFEYTADMSGVQVDPGETRWGQQVALLAESPRTALARWASWVAQTHGARTDKGALSGWNSWLFHGDDITGKDLLSEVDAVLKFPDRLRPDVMQIDAGYQSVRDQNEANEKFPEGMAFYAQRIAATGARPGLFLNFRGPPGFSTIIDKVRQSVRSGFTYLKINRTGYSIPPEGILRNTSFEFMREGFMELRDAAGDGTYLLYSDSHPERATVGTVDANRTGRTAERLLVREAMTDVLRSYHLNGRWFAVDNDSYYMGTDIANVSEIEGGWPVVRTWMSMVGLSCGAATTADPWHWESFMPYWHNVEVMTPPAKERTEVLDMCNSWEWPRLVGHVKRDWGDMTVALLWNPGTSERTVTLNFGEVGMDPGHRYAVWSFWDNRYLGVTKGSWTTPALAPSASQHLRFTDLDIAPDKPVLIGSGLHIYCGAAEIKSIVQIRGEMDIELTDAGARSGDLFIYSRWQPVWKGATGCAVAEIASAGEYVWRITLADRECGVPQRVTLGIILPVTRQPWFWALCSLVIVSLVFGVWRYLAWSRMQLALARLEQQSVRQQERARIARDLHDELGSGLTRILMLSDAPADGNQDKIHSAALEMTRELDEMVWAVNPKNDRLDSLAMFLDAYAQELLDMAGVESRVDFPVPLPRRPVTAQVRHSLFLAFKEALTNIVRHSGARRVQIRLVVKPDSFSLSLEDDGRGFTVPAASADHSSGHDGLENMNERLAAVGGRCTVTSAPGSGTRVEFELPLET